MRGMKVISGGCGGPESSEFRAVQLSLHHMTRMGISASRHRSCRERCSLAKHCDTT